MTRVQISEHVWVNVSRRNLCDNCVADVCMKRTGDNIEECDLFKSTFIAFKKCVHCGEIYELFSNFKSLDYDMCPICNERLKSPMNEASEVSADAHADVSVDPIVEWMKGGRLAVATGCAQGSIFPIATNSLFSHPD